MKKKILNIDDNDKLNPMAGTRNYSAGIEDGGMAEKETADDDVDDFDEELMPDELAFPKEQEDEDEMP